MMPGYRCTPCGVTWPARPEYETCVTCGGTCDGIDGNPTVKMSEARSLHRHALFADHYEQHCRQLGFEVDGPIPDELMEAAAHAQAQ